MVEIEERYLEQLRAAGLFVSDPYSPEHSLPDGVLVGKPTTTVGNSIPNYKTGYDDLAMDAPMIKFYSDGESWNVWAQERIPTPSPADFENSWKMPQEAVDDIIDFFLGNPERMDRKAKARVKKL
jgi:hypothetical protein